MFSVARMTSRGTRILVSKLSTSKLSSRRGPVLFVPPMVENELAVLEADKIKAVARNWTPSPKEGALFVAPTAKPPSAVVPRAEVLIYHMCQTVATLLSCQRYRTVLTLQIYFLIYAEKDNFYAGERTSSYHNNKYVF